MKSWKRLTAAALAVAVAMSGLGISGNVWKGKQAQAKERTETVYEVEGYKVTYSVEGKWEDGYFGLVDFSKHMGKNFDSLTKNLDKDEIMKVITEWK